MSHLTYKTYILILAFATSIPLFGQKAKVKKGEDKYEESAYIEAIDIYKDIAESGYESQEVLEKLGNSYYFNANYKEATKWYANLVEFTDNLDPIYYLRYSKSLNATGRIKESLTYYNKFIDLTNLKSATYSKDDYEELLIKNQDRYSLKPVNINTEGIEFGGAILDSTYLVFASTSMSTNKISQWNNLPYMTLFKAKINGDTELSQPEKLIGKINTKYHETTPTFTKDGKTMYYTTNNLNVKNRKNGKKLRIYRATLVDGEWTNIEDLTDINSEEFSTSHPALSPDETKLYFASDRPGGQGLTDLYVAEIKPSGKLGEPTNLGSHINTPGRDSFPFVSANNELYFSSDGHFGLGGYDVFYADLNEDAQNQKAINLGAPLNSKVDDIAFSINSNTGKGYVSSNRDSDQGYDDIYSVTAVACAVHGIVTDKETGEPLENVTITITDKDNSVVQTLTTDAKGFYTSSLTCDELFAIKGSKDQYNPEELAVKVSSAKTEHNFALEKKIPETPIEIGTDIAPILGIKEIYFDLNKSDIRPDAAIELQKVIAFLQKYPTVKLDVKSHTDSRGSKAYNKKLSNDRAMSTIAYLIDNGISPDRLTGAGYGESQLINRCKDGVKCSNEEHQQNRRSEFIIIEK